MKPCPAPDGSLLPDKQRAFLADLLQLLDQNGFSLSKLRPSLPAIVHSFDEVCATEDDLCAWCDELRQWVRWRRVPAYYLTYILQLVTQARTSVYHFLACDIYSNAQVNFAEDLALSSLETAYANYQRARGVLGPAFDNIGTALEQKLRVHYEYYVHWSRQFEYREANPCADHLYSDLSRHWLVSAVREDDPEFNPTDAKALARVVDQCNDEGHAFYRVLARRFLGLQHGADRRPDLAAAQYAAALDDALQLKLFTEIGHLRRLLGSALRATGDGNGARSQFEKAYAYECLEPAGSLTWYWQALSLRELGDTIMQFAGRRVRDTSGSSPITKVVLQDPERTLPPALAAYRSGRKLINGHMTFQCPFPLGRGAKQQIFRSFSDNALQVACMLQSRSDMLAEVEASGPGEATEIVTEIAAAREMAPGSVAAFRRNRALYYRTLNTLPARFEDYLFNVVEYSHARRSYLESSLDFDGNIRASQWADNVAERLLQLRIPDNVFLLFHVGQRETMMVLADLSSGTAGPFPIPIGEMRLREIHEEYAVAIKEAPKRQAALDVLLARYAEFLGPVLEPVVRSLRGTHLKIFPRLQMNAVPLHALRLQEKYLIEHCATVSYGQTLALFLQNHARPSMPQATNDSNPHTSSAAVRIVIGEDVPWYELLLPKARSMYGDALVEDHQPAWDELVRSITNKPTDDTVFACHGIYQPDNLEDSRLELAKHDSGGAVRFARVFAELDLQGCRSVMMGACESGLVRAEIAAEYLGLASAMLSSGVRYVIGALWTIPSVATAVLVHKYLELIKSPSTSAAAALCEAQRHVLAMTRDALAGWLCEMAPPGPEVDQLLKEIATWDENPFVHPYYWAGLQAVGDI